jgi:hypothetical protein
MMGVEGLACTRVDVKHTSALPEQPRLLMWKRMWMAEAVATRPRAMLRYCMSIGCSVDY